MRIDRTHKLGPLADVYLNGEKQLMAYVADDVEGWVDVGRYDWLLDTMHPGDEESDDFADWDGRKHEEMPIQRVYGDVRIEMCAEDLAGRKHRLTWAEITDD